MRTSMHAHLCLCETGRINQILNFYSAKPLLGHRALVWLVGFRMAGFMLSGNGIRVLGNLGLRSGLKKV